MDTSLRSLPGGRLNLGFEIEAFTSAICIRFQEALLVNFAAGGYPCIVSGGFQSKGRANCSTVYNASSNPALQFWNRCSILQPLLSGVSAWSFLLGARHLQIRVKSVQRFSATHWNAEIRRPQILECSRKSLGDFTIQLR